MQEIQQSGIVYCGGRRETTEQVVTKLLRAENKSPAHIIMGDGSASERKELLTRIGRVRKDNNNGRNQCFWNGSRQRARSEQSSTLNLTLKH